MSDSTPAIVDKKILPDASTSRCIENVFPLRFRRKLALKVGDITSEALKFPGDDPYGRTFGN